MAIAGDPHAGPVTAVSARPYPPHPITPYPPLIVNVALTGMVPQRTTVPNVPLHADEIVADAVACVDAGAAIVHLHARAADGAPEWRREAYAEIIAGIRAHRPETVVCVSTSGRAHGELERRADVLGLEGDVRPDMASLTLGSLNFRDGPSVNAPATIEALATMMRERGIKPELELFDIGMAYYARHLLERAILEPPLYANLLLGSIGSAPAHAATLTQLVDALPDQTIWAAAGLSVLQLPMNALAVFMGGHVRTGLEDNPYYDQRSRDPATNVGLVERIGRIASLAGRELASPADVRSALDLHAPA
jgi:uncharacterized protein (DUF849 family)